MTIANDLEAKLLNLALVNTSFAAIVTVYGALHTADPGETATASPLASTPRVAIAFNAAVSSTCVNATTVDWAPQASGTITYLSLWDGSSTVTANAMWSGALTTSKAVNAGDTVRLTSGSLAVTLD